MKRGLTGQIPAGSSGPPVGSAWWRRPWTSWTCSAERHRQSHSRRGSTALQQCAGDDAGPHGCTTSRREGWICGQGPWETNRQTVVLWNWPRCVCIRLYLGGRHQLWSFWPIWAVGGCGGVPDRSLQQYWGFQLSKFPDNSEIRTKEDIQFWGKNVRNRPERNTHTHAHARKHARTRTHRVQEEHFHVNVLLCHDWPLSV